ncbi:MAG: hypothetical protein IT307_02965 [Chloroflexi bacterium]|nr:hypothetical protein [Chloroflexota bacterium]
MAVIAGELVAPPIERTVPAHLGLPRPRLVLVAAALLVLTAIGSGSYLAYQGSIATTGYSIQRLELQRDSWKTRNDQLRAELARVRSLSYVEHEAVTRLQMQRPVRVSYVPFNGPPDLGVARVSAPESASTAPAAAR